MVWKNARKALKNMLRYVADTTKYTWHLMTKYFTNDKEDDTNFLSTRVPFQREQDIFEVV